MKTIYFGVPFLLIFFAYLFAEMLVFFKLGSFILIMPNEVFEILRDPFFFTEVSSVVFCLLALLFLVLYIQSEYAKYIHFREQRIYSVSLQELSRIWGAGKINIASKETIPVLYLKNFEQERTKEFISIYMEKNMRFFPTDKLEIILELFKILETEATNITSVATKFKSDPERTGNYQAVITPDGKTSYDVFAEFTLYEHTMNVANKAIDFLKEIDPISYETSMCDGIIIALAHDIGKLHKIKQFNKEYPDEILIQNPHQAISKMFFSEMWPGYSSIEDAIYNHHSAPNATALLTRMIIWADKEARKAEMLTWQTKRTEEKKTASTVSQTHEKFEDQSLLDDEKTSEKLPTIEKPKKSRKKAKDEETKVLIENEDEIDLVPILEPETEAEKAPEVEIEEEKKTLVIAPPIEGMPAERVYDTAEPIDLTDELEAKIIDDLRKCINEYTLEKPQGIHSISYNETVLVSIIHFNGIIKKHIYSDGEDPNEIKRIGMSISSKFFEKGYTRYMQKDAGCSTFFLNIKGKQNKFICVPLKAEVFNMDAFELDGLKDAWLKNIQISEFRKNES